MVVAQNLYIIAIIKFAGQIAGILPRSELSRSALPYSLIENS
jgi:hypothetical protein